MEMVGGRWNLKIFQKETTGVADGLDVGFEKKKGVKNDSEVLGPSSWENRVAFGWHGEDWGQQGTKRVMWGGP